MGGADRRAQLVGLLATLSESAAPRPVYPRGVVRLLHGHNADGNA